MKNCTNHVFFEALSICKVCKKGYCEECLVEGKEYYYCKNPACQEEYKKTLPKFITPFVVTCPNCKNDLELTDDERTNAKVKCPNCDTVAIYSVEPPKVLENKSFVKLLSSLNLGDIAIIKSILLDDNVNFYVTGENDHYIRPNLEAATFYVIEKDYEKAFELLKDFDLKIFALSTKQD